MRHIQIYTQQLNVYFLLPIHVGDCHTDKPGTNWQHYRAEFGQGSCYTSSVHKMDFSAAKDFCENELNMHLVFFETAGEQVMISSVCPARKLMCRNY